MGCLSSLIALIIGFIGAIISLVLGIIGTVLIPFVFIGFFSVAVLGFAYLVLKGHNKKSEFYPQEDRSNVNPKSEEDSWEEGSSVDVLEWEDISNEDSSSNNFQDEENKE